MQTVKLGYRKTNVGVFPEEWNVTTLGEITEIKSSKRVYQSEYVNEGVPFYRSKEIIELSKGNDPTVELFITKEHFKELKERYKAPSIGDLMITSVGSVGKTWISDGRDFYYKDGNLTQIVNNDNINTRYISYVFDSQYLKEQYIRQSNGSAQVALTLEKLRKLTIVLPYEEEQEKIVEILSTWDLAIEKQEQLIEKKKEFKKGLMQTLYSKGTKKEMLVKSKLGEVPESWNIVKAKEVFKSVSIKNNENEELLSVTQDKGTIPRSQLEGNVVMPEGSTSGYKLVVPNNFIISLRSFQGGLEISKHRGIISPAYTVLENKIEICHDYFKYYFKKEEFISRLNGAIVGIRDGKQISYADFGEMFLPVPSLEEQIKIAEILMVADKEIELLEKELEVLKLQKKGLMQRLLTGEVRVKV